MVLLQSIEVFRHLEILRHRHRLDRQHFQTQTPMARVSDTTLKHNSKDFHHGTSSI